MTTEAEVLATIETLKGQIEELVAEGGTEAALRILIAFYMKMLADMSGGTAVHRIEPTHHIEVPDDDPDGGDDLAT